MSLSPTLHWEGDWSSGWPEIPHPSQICSQGSRPVPDPGARIHELRVLQAASLTWWVWRTEETLKDKISQGFSNQATRQATSETFSFPFEGRSRKKPKRNWDQRLAWEPEVALYRGEETKSKWEEVSLQLVGAESPGCPHTPRPPLHVGPSANQTLCWVWWWWVSQRGFPRGFRGTWGTAVQPSWPSLRPMLDTGHDLH